MQLRHRIRHCTAPTAVRKTASHPGVKTKGSGTPLTARAEKAPADVSDEALLYIGNHALPTAKQEKSNFYRKIQYFALHNTKKSIIFAM
jgi:hypothetical protein